MRRHWAILAAVLAVAAPSWPTWAQSTDPAAVQKPIQGSDATDGKNRSGPDGWSWAPQTRDQASTGRADHAGDANSKPASDAGKTLKPGEDPGTPVAASNPGPAANQDTARKP